MTDTVLPAEGAGTRLARFNALEHGACHAAPCCRGSQSTGEI